MIYDTSTGDIIFSAQNEPAKSGGENLLARNADYTPRVSSEHFVKEHGGLRTMRRCHDATNPPDDLKLGSMPVSWQERCGLEGNSGDRGAAETAFRRMLGNELDFTWEDDGTLVITNASPAYNADGDWCNAVRALAHKGLITAADGTLVPAELLEGLVEADAEADHAVWLEAGDVLILDNKRVAHGRMPYQDGAGKRTMFTYLIDHKHL